jgi:hypothetical protein
MLRQYWRSSFPQERSFQRVTEIVTALLAGTTRKTIAATIEFRGKDQGDWSADYRVFTQSPWRSDGLFRGVLEAGLPLLKPDEAVILALDDTAIDRTSPALKSSGARWCHDPLAPVFVHPALKWGIPMLHAALLLPPNGSKRPTALTVAFEPILGKPPKREKPKDGDARPKKGRPRKEVAPIVPLGPGFDLPPDAPFSEIKTPPIATVLAVQIIRRIRGWLDEFGITRKLLVVVDSSYCNRTVIEGLPERTELVGRTRMDAKLYRPLATKCGKQIYGLPLPTPKEIGEDTSYPEVSGKFTFACDNYPVRYKEACPVLWKNGTKARPMRLLVLQPIRHGPMGKRGYRRFGYLLSTDLSEQAEVLIQAYLSRWEIEVLHRALKADIGIGDSQCNKASAKIYGAVAAGFAMLTLASILATGEVRSAMHHQLPKWQQNHRRWREAKRRKEGRPMPVYRATVRDNVTLLRMGLGLPWRNGISKRR